MDNYTNTKQCIDKLTELFETYKNNEYMTQRINIHIQTILPNTLETEYENYNERLIRTNTLHADQETFIKVFLNKYYYYYLPSTSCFYEYINSKYKIVNEDEIQHKLLSTITFDRKLMDWKHKTKINIIKQIKERSLFKSVPDTTTIQTVLNVLYPSFFATKQLAKYFLTVVGDNILKKSSDLKFLVFKKHAKCFSELDNITYLIGCNSVTQNFMTKYHDNHNYKMYRLLPMNEEFSWDIWTSIIKQLGLNLLCVATHYSNRYESSEGYITNKMDDTLKDTVLYLNNNSQTTIIEQFMKSSLQQINDDSFNISWKNLHYIWKLFLSSNQLPNMIYSNSLKHHLKQYFKYDEATDTFYNITSKFLPEISVFLKFWEENIKLGGTASEEFVDELEIDELYVLFKQLFPTNNMNEKDVLKIVKHFFQIEIIDDKYFVNIQCLLWNKSKNIDESIVKYKEQLTPDIYKIVSFDELYQYYTEYCAEKHFFIVNKKYFEKYIQYKMKEYIKFETFINFAT